MAKGRLRNIQNICSPSDPAVFMDRFYCAQMAKFDVHLHMKFITFFNFMNLINEDAYGTF